MKLGFTSFDQSVTPNLTKIQEISEDSHQNHHHTSQLNSLLNILKQKISVKSSSIHKIIRKQLQEMFQITTKNEESPSFYFRLAESLHETFHSKFKTNYHKFLISAPVLDLSYESKIFLLHVFRHYDSVFDDEKIRHNNFFKQPCFSKTSPWRQAENLTHPIEIKQYQMKMFMIYKGQFLDVFKDISGQKDKNKESLKRTLSYSEFEPKEHQQQSLCECKKKRKNPDPLLSLDSDELRKQRIEVKVYN